MSYENKPRDATPSKFLREYIMDSRIPKNEAEWWANRRIQELERENAALLAQVQDLELQNNAMRSTSRGKYAAMNEQLKRENAALRGTVEALGDGNDRLTIEITELRKDRLFK